MTKLVSNLRQLARIARNDVRRIGDCFRGSRAEAIDQSRRPREKIEPSLRERNVDESNVSKAIQLGNSNYVRTYQSDFNQSLIQQGGNSNSASIQQFGDHNNSGIAQDGNSNIADVMQGDPTSDYNESNLIQLLDGNFARIEQKTGNTNKVNLTQSDGAQAVINQFGTGNILMGLGSSMMALSLDGSTLDLNQLGNNNVVHLQQTGGSNHAVINQYGN
jgi:hypothetical protein